MCGVHLYKKFTKGCLVHLCSAQMSKQALDMGEGGKQGESYAVGLC